MHPYNFSYRIKKFLTTSFMLLVISLAGNAQERIATPINKPDNTKQNPCYTVPYMNELYEKAGIKNADAAFESWISTKIKERRGMQILGPVINYNLPVVFHIIHQGTAIGLSENIGQTRIHSQLAQMNKDFANLSNSKYGVAAHTGIQFYLAQKDPAGNTLAEPGIHRVNAPIELPLLGASPYTVSQFSANAKPNTIWDPTRYINIWVTSLSEGILGYATFPTLSGLPGLSGGETTLNAGVVIDGKTVGSHVNQGTPCNFSQRNAGKVLVHELGHFFGLRHIWGDATCGNDYVDDTPIHEEANFGVPTSPKPNSCGTPDEMFQNYMDYTNDLVQDTYTAKQVDRMQAVMLNSPNRKELVTSNVGVVNFTSNRISFVACGGSQQTVETGNEGSPLRYRDVNLLLGVEDRASGNATVTINAAGTATDGVDFTLITPTVNFVAGDGFKIVTIRVWDDGIPENSKTVILTYSISGTGVTAGYVAQFVLNILDDDNFTVAQTPVTLLNQNFDGTISGWSTLSNEANPANKFVVASAASGFTGSSAYITNSAIGASSPNAYTITTESLSILRTPVIDATGFNSLNLTYKFKSMGEMDDEGIWDFGTLMYAPSTNGTLFNTVPAAPVMVNTESITNQSYNFPATFNNSKFYLGFYWENDDNSGTQPPLAFDDVLIVANGQQIETNAGTLRGNRVPATTQVFFTSISNSKLIAKVEAASADIGVVEASVLQGGNSQASITTPYGTFNRSAKVIKIAPQVSFNGTATVTIYFTQEEINIWGGAKGILKVMQVMDNTSLTGELNEGNAKLLTPVVNDKISEAGYISYTVNVNDFSQFFLVDPATVLPVRLVHFAAQAKEKTIDLVWETANEINNRGFGVERSINGNEFSQLDFVHSKAGLGGAGSIQYSFSDATAVPGTLYYYRLRQEDKNGAVNYSAVRTASIVAKGKFSIYPNPAHDKIILATGKSFTGSVQLIGGAGQVLKTWTQLRVPQSGITLQLPVLPAGVYTIQINDGTMLSTQRINIR